MRQVQLRGRGQGGLAVAKVRKFLKEAKDIAPFI